MPPDTKFVPGETIFFSCQIEGYRVSPERRVHLAYEIQALDPQGVPVIEPIQSGLDTEVSPEDKQWKPKVRQPIPIPPLAPSGIYTIKISVNDDLVRATAAKQVSFEVRGHEVARSDTLAIRNLHFFRTEEDREPMSSPVYRPGETVWARFDITGYKFAARNEINTSYGVTVMAPSGKVLFTQPEAGTERSFSFYPKHYVPAAMSLSLQPNIRPGLYTVVITVRDQVGSQTLEFKGSFSVE